HRGRGPRFGRNARLPIAHGADDERSALDLGCRQVLSRVGYNNCMSPLDALEQCGHYIHFALRALPAALIAWRQPAELLRQLYGILLGALPLGLIAGMALGLVVWIHLHGVIEAHL